MLHGGVWGTVCDDGWSDDNAAVLCRQLGLPADNAQATFTAHFGEGTGPIWLDEVDCRGSEINVALCSHEGWGNHDCDHSEDAGVICESGNHGNMIKNLDCFFVHNLKELYVILSSSHMNRLLS